MYTLIGADQKEYGPVSADQVRQWIAEGRASAQTLARLDSGPWNPLSTFPEFAGVAGIASPPTAGSPPPTFPTGSAPAAALGDARQVVQAPAACLIALGGLGVFLHLGSLAWHLVGAARFMPPEPIGNPELSHVLEVMSGPAAGVFDLIGLAASLVIVVGGLQMLKLRSYGLCVTAAIIALLPCVSPCCCLGLPLGFWALSVLFKPEVKSAFLG